MNLPPDVFCSFSCVLIRERLLCSMAEVISFSFRSVSMVVFDVVTFVTVMMPPSALDQLSK